MAQFESFWYWQEDRLNGEWFKTYAFTTREYPAATKLCCATKPSTSEPFAFCDIDSKNHLQIHIANSFFENTPLMWYVLIREYWKNRPTQTLAAFNDNLFPDGTLIEVDEAMNLGIDSSKRIAAIRWGFGDPHLEQLYVDEQFRRQRISTKIIYVASLLNVAGNWGGFVYGGDQVTDMGSHLADAWKNSPLLRHETARLPSMDAAS